VTVCRYPTTTEVGDMDRAPRFEVRRNRLTRRYRVVLIGSNGEPLSVSETLNSVEAVNTNVQAQLDGVPNVKHIQWPSR
jgi:hypothetical protein